MKVTLINCGPVANDSEQKAIERLKSGLISKLGDGEWMLLTNLAFSTTHQRQSDEIDIVAIGPPGVRVIEVKHWTSTWVKQNAELVEYEAERVMAKARKVGTTLRRKVSNLGRVDGVFLVTQDALKVKPLEGQKFCGVSFHTLKTWQGAVALDEPVSLSPPQVKVLGKVLYPKTSMLADGDLRRMAGYVNLVLQTPSDERFHRIYNGMMRAAEEAKEMLTGGMTDDPAARSTLQELRDSLSALLGEPPAVVAPPVRFWTEDQIVNFRDRDYRIVSRLGSGGVGTTFKVVKIDGSTGGDLGAYVAKIARDEKTGKQVLQAYNLAHSHLHHSTALSTIFETTDEWRDNKFVALMAWIEGEPLSELSGLLPILAEDFHEESGEALSLRWLRTICDALDVLHRNGLVHGDVSPRNMIIANSEIVLTDYDCVAKVGTPAAAGTVIYSPHTHLEDRPVTPSDDFFALAASFFHVLFEKKPFMYDGNQAKERGLSWDSVERDEYPIVATFLDRATNPAPEQRFASAAEAKAVLNPPGHIDAENEDEPIGEGDSNASEPPPKPHTRRENEVPWLQSLLQSYPGSRWGNSETRGLDTDFASQTYVETNLEQSLFDQIQKRQVRLVVLCGNAGDGKTALLQHLAGRLGFGDHASSERILEKQMEDSLTVRMNLDGSASWQGRSADELLDEFLEPFQKGPPDEDIVHLLAINDGRLLEWMEGVEHRHGGETPLTQALDRLLNSEESASESHIRFVSLNQRSLVGSIVPSEAQIETGFLDLLLNSLYGREKAPEKWAPCETCSAEDRCEVRRTMRLFGPDGLPDLDPKERRARARQRLFQALQAVHLRGETHITIRELRATLVYILFGVHFCRDYHEGADTPLPFWYRAFSPESPGRQGDVLQELIHFDPALEAHPQIDRQLLRAPSVDTNSGVPHYSGMKLESARRRAYFEWTEDEIAGLADNPHAFGLAQARHYQQFRSFPIDKDNLDDLCQKLCEGIARLENLPPQALDRKGVVPLRITPRTPTETAFWVEKPVTDFRLEADLPAETEGLDRLHRQVFLIYRYRDGREERLRLGADLFHLLLELSNGYQLGDVSTDDAFAHLSIFVQRLVREDDRKVLAWNPMQDDAIYEVSAEIVENDGTGVQQLMIIQPLKEETKNGR